MLEMDVAGGSAIGPPDMSLYLLQFKLRGDLEFKGDIGVIAQVDHALKLAKRENERESLAILRCALSRLPKAKQPRGRLSESAFRKA
jgi:hypothetical protein